MQLLFNKHFFKLLLLEQNHMFPNFQYAISINIVCSFSSQDFHPIR